MQQRAERLQQSARYQEAQRVYRVLAVHPDAPESVQIKARLELGSLRRIASAPENLEDLEERYRLASQAGEFFEVQAVTESILRRPGISEGMRERAQLAQGKARHGLR